MPFLALLLAGVAIAADPGTGDSVLRILCLGDFLTARGPEGDASWPRRLEGLLNQAGPEKPFVVFNHAPASDSAIFKAALPGLLARVKPRFVIAMIGDDDLTYELSQSLNSQGVAMMNLPYPGSRGQALAQSEPDPAADKLLAELAARAVHERFPSIPLSGKPSPAGSAAFYRLIASSHQELGDESGARESLESLLKLAPDDFDAWAALAEIHFQDNNTWDALACAEKAAALGRSPRERARYLQFAAEMRAHVGDFVGGAENLRRALELKPGDGELLLRLAHTLRDKPERALEYAEKAAAAPGSDPRRSAAHRLSGELLLDLGSDSRAAGEFMRALKLAPHSLDVLAGLIRALRSKRMDAVPYAGQAARAAENMPLWLRPAALRLSARLWAELEDYPRAAESLGGALSLNRDDIDALIALARIKDHLPAPLLARLVTRTRAVKREVKTLGETEALRALENDPLDLDSLNSLIGIKRDQLQLAQARSFTQRLTAAAWRSPAWRQAAAYRLAARHWLELGSESGAAANLDRALDMELDSIETLEMLSRLRRRSADPFGDNSRDSFANGYAGVHDRIAALRLELGDPEGARRNSRLAREIGPRTPRPH